MEHYQYPYTSVYTEVDKWPLQDLATLIGYVCMFIFVAKVVTISAKSLYKAWFNKN